MNDSTRPTHPEDLKDPEGSEARSEVPDRIQDGAAARLADTTRLLRSAKRDLDEANDALAFHARHASHDLQAPLKNILALMDLCDLEEGVPASVTTDLQLIRDEVGRMLGMIGGVLEFTRCSQAPMETATVDLEACCAAAVGALDPLIERTGAALRVGALPRVEGDAALLQLALQHLLQNGIRYQPAGQRPELQVSAREEQGQVLLEVSDNGIGLDEGSAELAFTPLGRLHPSDQYEGEGLGLAIARKVARRHGGEVTYRSTPGEGATFTVTLPRTP